MDTKIDSVIREMVAVLVREYHPKKIILFGSYAYGNPDKESDIDLLVIKKTYLPFYKRLAEVRKIVSTVRQGHAFEPLVLTPEELSKRIAKKDQFFEEIISKGNVMYG